MLLSEFQKMSAAEVYLDWVNNWLTLSAMAESYGVTVSRLHSKIERGRKKAETGH